MTSAICNTQDPWKNVINNFQTNSRNLKLTYRYKI